MNFKGLCFVDMPFAPKRDLKKYYEPRCRSIPRMLGNRSSRAAVLPITR